MEKIFKITTRKMFFFLQSGLFAVHFYASTLRMNFQVFWKVWYRVHMHFKSSYIKICKELTSSHICCYMWGGTYRSKTLRFYIRYYIKIKGLLNDWLMYQSFRYVLYITYCYSDVSHTCSFTNPCLISKNPTSISQTF